MPYCEPCDKYLAPSAATRDGSCPDCGEGVEATTQVRSSKIPWHFWVVLAAASGYVGWRAIEGVIWLVQQA